MVAFLNYFKNKFWYLFRILWCDLYIVELAWLYNFVACYDCVTEQCYIVSHETTVISRDCAKYCCTFLCFVCQFCRISQYLDQDRPHLPFSCCSQPWQRVNMPCSGSILQYFTVSVGSLENGSHLYASGQGRSILYKLATEV